MVWNSASVTFWKICYYGRQWDLIWCNDSYTSRGEMAGTRIHGIRHMVKDHGDSQRENLLPPLHGLLFSISSKGSFICTNYTDRTAHTSLASLAGKRNISMGPPLTCDPSHHEQTLYHRTTSRSLHTNKTDGIYLTQLITSLEWCSLKHSSCKEDRYFCDCHSILNQRIVHIRSYFTTLHNIWNPNHSVWLN